MMMFARQPFGLCHVTVVAQATFVYTSINTLAQSPTTALCWQWKHDLSTRTHSLNATSFWSCPPSGAWLLGPPSWPSCGQGFERDLWQQDARMRLPARQRLQFRLAHGTAVFTLLTAAPNSLFLRAHFYYARHSAVSVTGHRPDDISFTYKLCCITILFGILNFPPVYLPSSKYLAAQMQWSFD